MNAGLATKLKIQQTRMIKIKNLKGNRDQRDSLYSNKK